MAKIKHKILVLSGKGGVGKSSIAANLAVWLANHDRKTALLDVDIHGPSVPNLLNLQGTRLQGSQDSIEPVIYDENLKVMSVGFLLQNPNDALIWRGPMKHNVINQFVNQVNWGDLDYLVVDCPPGTGDEPLSVAQLMPDADGAIIVTTPQQMAVVDVKKCITFCRQIHIPILGVVENMSGFICPHCNKRVDIFTGDGGESMAEEFGVDFLGRIPMDPAIGAACDAGKPFINLSDESETVQAMNHIFAPILEKEEAGNKNNEIENVKGENTLKIAIPLVNGELSAHFGHCEQFAIIDVDKQNNRITDQKLETPPAHEPGVLPKWLGEMGVNLIIAGGMGQRAQQLFTQAGIDVVCGAPQLPLEQLIEQHLKGTLQVGDNICDH